MQQTHRTDPNNVAGFSAAEFRKAMGPGYQVSTFREQPILMGRPAMRQPVSSLRPPACERFNLRRTWTPRLRLLRLLRQQGRQPTTVPATEPIAGSSTELEEASAEDEAEEPAAQEPVTQQPDTETTTASTETYLVEVWADNWMAFYVDGELVAEDSVSITTERSFNSEVFTFEAAAPFTIAIEAKDFKETDSGIEYIGERNQQMGDGGIIAQVTNTATGEIVAVTNSDWSALVVHRAPLNTSCVQDPDPDATCEFEITETPADWASANFDDSGWAMATEWSEAAVSPKDGYDQISWASSAELVWGADLEVDNTVLLRWTVAAS